MLGFNAVESKRQNAVLKNLQELDDNKNSSNCKVSSRV